MKDRGWIAFWVVLALLIAGGVGYRLANGEPWQLFIQGLLLAFAVQQLGLHVRGGSDG